MTREEKIDQIVNKCRRTIRCEACRLYGYYTVCPVPVYADNKNAFSNCNIEHTYRILFGDEEMKKEFTKADLQDGMVVTLRDGKKLLVVKRGQMLRMLTEVQFLDGKAILDNLKSSNVKGKTRNSLDIVRVFAPTELENATCIGELIHNHGELLWERIEEMTFEEVEKELGYKIKIVAPPVGQDS